MLHNELGFRNVVLQVSMSTGIPPAFIEKDYYVFMLLKFIAQNPNAMFKGGTSLVKGWRIEDRFSEDIDINLIPEVESTDSSRTKLCNCCENAVRGLGLQWIDETRHRREFNRFTVPYDALFPNDILRKGLMIEEVAHKRTKVRNTTYEILEISNYIWDMYRGTSAEQSLYNYGLSPFKMPVQNMDVTFVEKCLSLANKYLENSSLRVGRHLYDIYCMITRGNLLSFDLNYVISETKSCLIESKRDICLRQVESFKTILLRSLYSDFYMQDFNMNLMIMKVVQDNVSYQMCKELLIDLLLRLNDF